MDRRLTPGTAWIVSSLDPAFRPFLAELFALDLVFVTGIGEHAHDATWPDMTAAGRASRPGFVYREHLERTMSHGATPTALLKRILAR